jgi:uncharacterized membrane protein AbrB (regulator of aidB expression)
LELIGYPRGAWLAILPRVIASILTLIATCSVLAAVLVVAAGIDPLTAYLATGPSLARFMVRRI